MKIYVEQCFSGNNNFHFRCTVITGPYIGARFGIPCDGGQHWRRVESAMLRDVLVRAYGVPRDSIKLVHH